MDGRTDFSVTKIKKGQKDKIFFDKDFPFQRIPEHLPITDFRPTEFQVPAVDQIHTITNFAREVDNFFASNPIRRSAMAYNTELTPLSRKQAWRIHRAQDPIIENELLDEVIELNQERYHRDGEAMMDQLIENNQLLQNLNLRQKIENEKIVP